MSDFYSGWLAPPNGYAKYRLHLSVTVASQDIAANTTILNWKTTLEKDRSQNGFYSYAASFSTTIDGTFVMDSSGSVPSAAWTGWSSWTIGSGQTTVTHSTDGTKTITVAGAYVGANSGWAIGTVALVGTLTMALPTIARATSPTVTPSPAVAGTIVTVDLPRADASYTHDVTWATAPASVETNLVTNPSFETVQSGTTVVRTNTCVNPNYLTASSGWNAWAGNATSPQWDNTVPGALSGFSVKITSSAYGAGMELTSPLTIGVTFTASLYVKTTSTALGLKPYGVSGAGVQLNASGAAINGWQRYTTNARVATQATFYLDVYANAGESVWVSNVLIEQTDQLRPYFDGSTPAALGFTYAWTGTVNASSSTAKAAVVTTRTNLAPNPSFETTSGVVTVRTNFYPNPVNQGGTAALAGGNTLYASGSAAGSTAVESEWQSITATSLPAGTRYGYRITVPIASASGVTVNIRTRLNSSLAALPANVQVHFYVDALNSANAVVGHFDVTTTDFTNPLSGSITPTDAITQLYWYVWLEPITGSFTGSAKVGVAWGMVEAGVALGGDFYGDSPAVGDFTYAWSGVIGASSSLQQALSVAEITAAKEYQTTVNGGKALALQCSIAYGANPSATDVAGAFYAIRVTATNPDTVSRSFRLAIYDGSGYPADTTFTILAGATQEFSSPALRATVGTTPRWYIYGTDGATPILFDKMVVSKVVAVGDETSSYFDGSTPSAGDFTYAWSGTANASASVQQGILVAGTSGSATNGVGISSYQYPSSGSRSLRIISTAATNDEFVEAVSLLSGYTFKPNTVYTIAGDRTLSGPQAWFNGLAFRVYIGTELPVTLDVPPDSSKAGTTRMRGTFTTGASTAVNFLRLYNGSPAGSGDVWWDNFVLTEGTYTGAYFDGDTVDSFQNAWTGASNASTSTKTAVGTIATGAGASTTWTIPDVMPEFPKLDLVPLVITAVTKSGTTVIGSKQVTLFEKKTPNTPAPLVVAPASQFDVRARLVEYIGSDWVRTKILPANTIQLVDPYSATATCTIGMTALNAVGFADYGVIDIEVFDGLNWIFTNHRFVLSRSDGDDLDPTKMKTYSGSEFIDYSLGFAYVQGDYFWDGGKDHAAPTTPGDMMNHAITDAKARGWGQRVGVGFSSAQTSLGEPWANKAVNRNFSKGTPLSQMLNGLVSDGLVEYETSYVGTTASLVLLNPGTGSDFSASGASPVVNLKLADLKRTPRRATSEKRLTRVTVAGDKNVQISRETAPFDSNVFGQMEGWVSASGVTDNAAAGTIGDNALRDNGSAVSERTFEYSSQSASPQFYPYAVFRPGDWVLIPDGDNTIKDRISQITIDKQGDGSTTLTVLTGDRILSGTASLAKRQAAQTGGSIAGGGQSTPAPLDSRIPAGPIVTSTVSAGYWNTDGAAQSTITIAWGAVSQAMNGASINCDIYEVFWRPSLTGVEWSFRSSTAEMSIELPGWDVTTSIDLRVRARSVDGIYGEFSEDQTIITIAPAVDLSGPVMTDLYTDGVGTIYAVWGGILGTTVAPKRLAYVSAEVSSDAGATFSTMGTSISAAGSITLNPKAWGDFVVRLRGYDRLGNAGSVSATQTITLIDPHVAPPIPATPVGLAATAGASWDAAGIVDTSWFNVSWTAVTLDELGAPINVVGYDIWGKKDTETELRFLTSSSSNAVRLQVGAGEIWSLQVKATSNFGGVSALSAPINAVADATIPAPVAPTAPTLDQYAGLLRIVWAGGGMVPQVKYAYASISTTVGGVYTRAGMPLNGAGEVVVPGLATGVTYFAKINIVDERGQVASSVATAGLLLDPITGTTIQTSAIANTGIKMTTASLTAYDVSGNPTFILNASTGEVWIAPYNAVFDLGASGSTATTGAAVTGIAISSQNSSFNTFIHPSGVQIRNDQIALSWWEADASDASLVNFFSPRAVIGQRLLVGEYEMTKELKSTGSRLVTRYKGA